MDQNIDPALRDAPVVHLFWPTVVDYYLNSQYPKALDWIVRAVDTYLHGPGSMSPEAFWTWIYATLRNTNAAHLVQGFRIFLGLALSEEEIAHLQDAVDDVIQDRAAVGRLMQFHNLPITQVDWEGRDIMLRCNYIHDAEVEIRRAWAANQITHNDPMGQQPPGPPGPHSGHNTVHQPAQNPDVTMHQQPFQSDAPQFDPLTPVGQDSHNEQVNTAAQPLESMASHSDHSNFTNQSSHDGSVDDHQPSQGVTLPLAHSKSPSLRNGDMMMGRESPQPAMSAAPANSAMLINAAAPSVSAAPTASVKPVMTAGTWKKSYIDLNPKGPVGKGFIEIDKTAQGLPGSEYERPTPSHHDDQSVVAPDTSAQPLTKKAQAELVLLQLMAKGEEQKAKTGKYRTLADEDPEASKKMHEEYAHWIARRGQ